jgi:tetratricopeptide (TPR) repeat protein
MDTSKAEARALAEALLLEGRALGQQGQLERACLKFQESQRIDPALETQMHLATCYAEQGRTASAWSSFGTALELARQRGDRTREAFATKHIAELEHRLSFVAILLESDQGDSTLALDGKLLSPAATGTPLPLDPGSHRIDVSKAGRQRWTNEFMVQAGPSVQTITIPALTWERREPTVAPKSLLPLPSERTQGRSAHVAGTVLLGVGAVGVIAGGYFGVRAYRQAEEADRYCSGSICTMEGIYGYDAAHRSAWYSNAGFGVGIAGLATGLYLILASPRTPTKQGGLRVEGGLGNLRLKGHF